MITVKNVLKEKGPGYTISLSTGESLLVSEDILVRYRLLKNQEISPELVEEIKQAGQQDLGYQMSLNYLSYQLRTEKEVRDYLKEKEINSQDISAIIERLQEVKLVDDQMYAESFVRTQMRLSDKGPTVLKQKLRQKGIKPEVADAALMLYTVSKQEEVASKLAEKTIRKNQNKTFQTQQQKLQQTLMTKGFSQEISRSVLAQITLEKDVDQEEVLLNKEGDKLWRKNARFEPFDRKQKTMQGLMRKGFDYDLIKQFIVTKELEDE
ncbi:recombination regulator RecX [Vagococcus xieshaowenii]|uniref:Regulatory protein RecX n=1 Tax=Vagococcus xieshaowenii TaxID=2562451 RepID=A0AAJ5EFV5_9ENTE|nr:recombination regulator RecX [Vagococcus xieshaowenii]QCA29244.1 recombination regulator RecX [Vagococcus xieshaowenii]TFZ43244.1 recombination regulator RecX [Vagococcus xieshaowenii]